MSAKSYKQKLVEPVIRRLRRLIKTVIAKSIEGWENFYCLHKQYEQLEQENRRLKYKNAQLQEINDLLRDQNTSYRLVEKVFGKAKLKSMIDQARGNKQHKQLNTH